MFLLVEVSIKIFASVTKIWPTLYIYESGILMIKEGPTDSWPFPTYVLHTPRLKALCESPLLLSVVAIRQAPQSQPLGPLSSRRAGEE